MKIELLATSSDRPAPGEAGRDTAARKEAGRGFADVVRGLLPKADGRAAPERADAPGDGPADAGERQAAGGATDPAVRRESGIEAEALPDEAAPAEARSDTLRSVLDLIGAALPRPPVPAAPDASPRSEAEPGSGGAAAAQPPLPAGAAEDAAADDGADAGTARRPLRLDVVRMETHFEPRRDGAAAPGAGVPAGGADVPAAEAGAAAPIAAASPPAPVPARAGEGERARPPAPALGGQIASASASGAQAPVADAPPAGEHAAGAPVRFAEAVARLGAAPAASPRDVSETRRAERGAAAADPVDGEPPAVGEAAPRETRPAPASTPVSPAARQAAAVAARGESTNRAEAAGVVGGSAPAGTDLAAQVARRIGEAFGGGGDAPAAPAGAPPAPYASASGGEAHLRLRAGGAALRTLTLQLQPEHLGTLEVSMRLREGQLMLEIGASRPETAAALANDEASLRQLLEKAGFALDDGAIAITVRDAASGAAAPARSGDTSPNGAGAGNAQSGGGGGGGAERDGAAASGGDESRRRPSGEGRDGARREAPDRAPQAHTYL